MPNQRKRSPGLRRIPGFPRLTQHFLKELNSYERIAYVNVSCGPEDLYVCTSDSARVLLMNSNKRVASLRMQNPGPFLLPTGSKPNLHSLLLGFYVRNCGMHPLFISSEPIFPEPIAFLPIDSLFFATSPGISNCLQVPVPC